MGNFQIDIRLLGRLQREGIIFGQFENKIGGGGAALMPGYMLYILR